MNATKIQYGRGDLFWQLDNGILGRVTNVTNGQDKKGHRAREHATRNVENERASIMRKKIKVWILAHIIKDLEHLNKPC